MISCPPFVHINRPGPAAWRGFKKLVGSEPHIIGWLALYQYGSLACEPYLYTMSNMPRWTPIVLALLALILIGRLFTDSSEPEVTPPAASGDLRTRLAAALGAGNRGLPRIRQIQAADGDLIIAWSINDNLSEALLQAGARHDIYAVLQVVSSLEPVPDTTRLSGFFGLQDAFGNVQETQAVTVAYSAATLGRINWDGFLAEDVYTIADSVTLHPIFDH